MYHCECLPFPAREDETGGLGLPVPSEIIKLKYIIFKLILVTWKPLYYCKLKAMPNNLRYWPYYESRQ